MIEGVISFVCNRATADPQILCWPKLHAHADLRSLALVYILSIECAVGCLVSIDTTVISSRSGKQTYCTQLGEDITAALEFIYQQY